MKVKEAFETACGLAGAGVAAMIGGCDELFIALVVAMTIDLFFGVACASLGYSDKSPGGKIQSRAFIKGVFKKVYEIALIMVAVQADVLLGTSFCRDGVIIAFFVGEVISITENGGKLGVPLPAVVTKALDILNEKIGGEEEK